MPKKYDCDATAGNKLLRLFQKLMVDGQKHFQRDLAEWLKCSPQTIMRLIVEIENVTGTKLKTGMDGHRRWYQLVPSSQNTLSLDFEELRYLNICRELAEPYLPEQVRHRLDDSIFHFSMFMADSMPSNSSGGTSQFAFFSKGRIDYTPHYGHIDLLFKAMETRVVCRISYLRAGKSEVKEYIFGVRRIISMNNALYVLGAELTEDFQSIARTLNLAVHRIREVILTEEPLCVDIPDVDAGSFGLPWHEPRTFRIQFAAGTVADYVRERIWADSQTLVDTEDGGVILEITTRSEPELSSWVRSFGDQAKFLEVKDCSNEEGEEEEKNKNE